MSGAGGGSRTPIDSVTVLLLRRQFRYARIICPPIPLVLNDYFRRRGGIAYEPPLANCFEKAQALGSDVAFAVNLDEVELEQVKLGIFAESLHAQTSDGRKHGESERAAFFEGSEDLKLSVAQSASVDVGLVAETLPVFKREGRVILSLAEHFDFFGALDSGAGIAANRGGNLIENATVELNIGNALLNDALHFVIAVRHKVHDGKTVFEGGEKAVKLSGRKNEAHLGEVELVFNVLVSVIHHVLFLGVEDGEESGDKFARQFMTLIKKKAALLVLNLRHHLLEELFFILHAAAVNFNEDFLAGGTNGAGKLSLANATLTVEHEEGQDARRFVSVQIKGKLTLDVFLTDDGVECGVHSYWWFV